MYVCLYKNARYRSQFWTDFREVNMVDAVAPLGELYYFQKSAQ